MENIKCTCVDPKCKASLQFVDGNIAITDASGREQLIFLDSSAIIKIVLEAKQALLEKTFGK